jgi:hypothetical protein
LSTFCVTWGWSTNDHVLHLLLESVPLLADPLRTEDKNGAGRGLHFLRPEVHRPGVDDGGIEGLKSL